MLIFSYNSFFCIYIYSFYRFSSLYSYSYVFLIKIKCIYTILNLYLYQNSFLYFVFLWYFAFEFLEFICIYILIFSWKMDNSLSWTRQCMQTGQKAACPATINTLQSDGNQQTKKGFHMITRAFVSNYFGETNCRGASKHSLLSMLLSRDMCK